MILSSIFYRLTKNFHFVLTNKITFWKFHKSCDVKIEDVYLFFANHTKSASLEIINFFLYPITSYRKTDWISNRNSNSVRSQSYRLCAHLRYTHGQPLILPEDMCDRSLSAFYLFQSTLLNKSNLDY